MSNNSSVSSGIGFCELLAIVFIVLKLCGTIAWSWWWVLSPIWLPFAVVGIVLLIVAIVAGVVWTSVQLYECLTS